MGKRKYVYLKVQEDDLEELTLQQGQRSDLKGTEDIQRSGHLLEGLFLLVDIPVLRDTWHHRF
jgi:hypothetical protein